MLVSFFVVASFIAPVSNTLSTLAHSTLSWLSAAVALQSLTQHLSTGLTFGTISALFGYSHGYINMTQYTVLVTVVILSAVVPTMIA